MTETGKLIRVDFGTSGESSKTSDQLAYERKVAETMSEDLEQDPYCCAPADLKTGAILASLISRVIEPPKNSLTDT